jgi:hypothetical protein
MEGHCRILEGVCLNLRGACREFFGNIDFLSILQIADDDLIGLAMSRGAGVGTAGAVSTLASSLGGKWSSRRTPIFSF